MDVMLCHLWSAQESLSANCNFACGLQEYIGWAGEWQAANQQQATGYNDLLAEVIAEGGSAGAAKAASLDTTAQDIPLRLALVGAPFAGKTALALKLADEHGCKASISSCPAHACCEAGRLDCVASIYAALNAHSQLL